MAAKSAANELPFEEIQFQNDRVALCLLVNRRARTMRIIDFRSGPNPAKRLFVVSLAQREGIDRVFTLVERDEVSTWSKVGFDREATIPGFYKRSDAYVLGMMVPRALRDSSTEESGVRPAVVMDPAADKIYQRARRLAKEQTDAGLPAVRVQRAREPDLKKAIAGALRSRRALSTFEPFGRDVQRDAYMCTARGGFSLAASVESQACFSNAFLELLSGPRGEREAELTTGAVRGLCDVLFEQGVVSCFAVSPANDAHLAASYVANGFRRTGRLNQHILVGSERVDAYVWSRKLATGEDE